MSRVLPALLVLSVLCGCGQLDQSQLSSQAQSLQSLAQEGIVLAQDIQDGKAHTPFVQVHAEEMASSASDVSDSLNSQDAPKELAGARAKAVAFAKDIASQLQKLSDHPDQAGTAASVRAALQTDAQRLKDSFGGSE